MVSSCQCWFVTQLMRLIIARASIIALMSKISVGRLRVLAPEQIYEFGPGGGLNAELKIVSDTFWVRLLLLGDLVRHRICVLTAGFCRGLYVRRRSLQRSCRIIQGIRNSNLLTKDVSCQPQIGR